MVIEIKNVERQKNENSGHDGLNVVFEVNNKKQSLFFSSYYEAITIDNDEEYFKKKIKELYGINGVITNCEKTEKENKEVKTKITKLHKYKGVKL